MKIQKQIDIYLVKKHTTRQIDVVQYDTGIQLVFTVMDFNILSGATATLYVQKPSGKFVYQEDGITVADNTITIDLDNQAITEYGKAPYQVSLTSGSDVITTFTGLMLVQKSLKDAGATESKTVIRAFDEAVSDHVAEFQTKAEQIVAACIATIPDDYTTMEAKVNEFANAIKGNLSGVIVSADDVSPVEHELPVKVKSKNMVTFGGSGEKNGLTYSCVDGVWTISGTPSVAYAGIQSRDMTGLFEDGATYTVSQSKNFASSGADGAIYLQIIAERYDGTQTYVVSCVANRSFTVDKSQYKTYVMTLQAGTALAPVSLTGFTVQLEKGTRATEHTPYIDPSTVTVTRYGEDESDNAETYIPASDGTVSGLTSLSPNMTILTDTEGVIVECEYNRDTNKVIDKLINAITALCGTV